MDYWLAGWKYRLKLTVDSGDISDILSNFPVLIYISAASGIGNVDVSCVFDELVADANRKKIAVTTSDGNTECYVEIEKWDDGNEQAWLWVKIPSVASGTDTDLYLYYGIDHADNNTYVGDTNDVVAENVWDANFMAVYHMADGIDNAHIYDSTSNDNDGTKTGANQPVESTDLIGDSQTFDGTDRINCGNAATFNITDAVTIEARVKPSTVTECGILAKDSYNDTFALYARAAAGEMVGFRVESTGAGTLKAGNLVAATRYTLVGRYDKDGGADNVKIFADGAEIGSRTQTDVIPTNADDLYIGFVASTTNWWKGIIDEIRVSDIARTEAWIAASHESYIDDLITFGVEVRITCPRWDFFTWA